MKLDKNYKVRVTPEQSRQIQKLLFDCGFQWAMTGQTIHSDREIILIEPDKLRLLNGAKSTLKFYIEIAADDLIALLTDLSKSAENPLQDMELTPEFEAVEPVLADNSVNIQDIDTDILDTNADIKDMPKFKVGDKVYIPNIKNLCTIRNDGKVITSDGQYYCNLSDSHDLCFVLATPENYEMLCKLYPHIEFEAPPKPLTGIELAKKLIAKGHNYLVVDTVIGIRVLTRLEGNTLIDSNNVRLDELDDITPLDDETGEPLTESILND